MSHPKKKIRCLQCGSPKMVFVADIKRGKGRFCNRKCFNSYRRILPENLQCVWCGKTFKNKDSQRNKRFCSKECYTEYQKGKPTTPNILGKRGIKPRTYHLRKRPKHAGAKYQDWRKAVFERDNYTCQQCHQHGGRLNADHIMPYAKYPELRYDLANGRTLCVDCHKKTDSYGWQNYWKHYIAEDRLRQCEMDLK